MAEENEKKDLVTIAREIDAQGFIKGTPVYESILKHRLEGYNPETCSHPKSVMNGQYLLCLYCGHQELT